MSDTELWGDVRTASREFLQSAFEQQTVNLFREYAQQRIELESVNQNRFEDDPIILNMNFEAQYKIFRRFDLDKQQEFLSMLFS